LLDVLGADPQLHPAGQRHHYSDPGYALLGALVERVRGEAWGEVLRREVLRAPACPPEAMAWDSGYGLGMQLLRRDGRLLAGHTGSMPGFVATVWVSPDDDLGTVVLANATAGFAVGTVAADLLETIAEREPRIPAPWRPLRAVDPLLLDLAGPWYRGPAPYVLRPLADGLLELAPMSGSGRGTRLRPTGDGDWKGTNGFFAGERLRLERDAAGAVSHLDLGTHVFTRQPYDPAAPVPGGVDAAGWRAD
jgi:hypothetical protein